MYFMLFKLPNPSSETYSPAAWAAKANTFVGCLFEPVVPQAPECFKYDFMI